MSDKAITDKQCSADPKEGDTRFCFDCRKVIYSRSHLPQDAYYVGDDSYYHHVDCSKAE